MCPVIVLAALEKLSSQIAVLPVELLEKTKNNLFFKVCKALVAFSLSPKPDQSFQNALWGDLEHALISKQIKMLYCFLHNPEIFPPLLCEGW